jgi:CRISPR-associated protein Cas1
MKKLLNTLYVTSEGAVLHKDGENLVAEIDGAERARVPFHMIASVVTFGAIGLSPPLVQACAGRGIVIVLLDRNGRFSARVEGPTTGNVLLRRQQYRASDRPAGIAQGFVCGKIANQRTMLQRALRDYGQETPEPAKSAIEAAITRFGGLLRAVQLCDDLDTLRGMEGEAARLYFGVFNDLVRSPDSEICFRGRSRRPPLDPVNALLSFLYTLLTHDCRSAAEAVGLDPAVGFLHRDRPGRPSLALDLMEEMRPAFADRLALTLLNRRQIRIQDFHIHNNGAVLLTDEGRKTVLTSWQERKKVERKHPFLDEPAPLGLAPFLQAQLLARHLRGDLDAYPPWFWK